MNVLLIGYRASGKTSVGRRVAELLGYRFHDTDEIVMKTAGKTIRQIVDECGWPLFREMEKGAIASVSRGDGCVVALGGGAVLDEENVKQVSGNSLFIWLRADAETVVNRMKKDGNNGSQRPPLTGGDTWKEVAELLRSREEVYRKNANFIVDTGNRSIEEASEEVLRILRSSLFGISGFFGFSG